MLWETPRERNARAAPAAVEAARVVQPRRCFPFPTLEDGFAVVLAQAYANALPIITTTNCAGPDMIRHGQSGWVLPIRRSDLFIEQLLWCDANRDRLAEVVRRLYDTWQARDWNDVAADFERIVSNVVGRGANPRAPLKPPPRPHSRENNGASEPLSHMEKSQFTPLLATWIVVLVPLFIAGWRSRSVGLVAAFCFQMWMFYWLGAALHALPWSELDEDEAVLLGFQQATYAMAAFAAGALLLGPGLGKTILGRIRPEPAGPIDFSVPRRYTICGLVAYFVLSPTIGSIPGMNAIPACASQLVVIGCCLQCWLAWHLKGRSAMLRSLGPALLIPLVILMRRGL